MPPTPNSDSSEPTQSRPRAFPWFWFGIFIGTLISAAGLGLAAWAWVFINEDLSPVLSEVLSKELERPVDLGDVERVTLNSIRVGPSALGASADDPTRLTAETITVQVNPLEALFTGRLGLDLTVLEADGYLQQDPEKGWLNVDIPEQEDDQTENRFKVRLDRVRVRDSLLTLVPVTPAGELLESIPIEDLNGQVNVDTITVDAEDAQRTRFDFTGDPIRGGELSIKGEVQPIPQSEVTAADKDDGVKDLDSAADGPSDNLSNTNDKPQNAIATNLAIQADKAPVADVLRFTLATISLPTNAVDIESGQVSGTVDFAFRPNQPVDYSGVISVDEGALVSDAIPLPVENIAGQTRFEGNQWTIDRLAATYGEIDAVAEGLLDFDKGYDLDVTAGDVTVEEFVATVDLKLPAPVDGNFDAIAQVNGPLNNPLVTGSVIATDPLLIDKVTFANAAADITYRNQLISINNIAATPSTGGSLKGDGQVRIGQGSPFAFNLTGRSLPAKQFAQIYGANPNFQIGLISADVAVVGNDGSVNTNIRWNAPAAQYPASGVIDVNGRTLRFRDTVAQVGGGLVRGTGTLVGKAWNADLNLAGVNLGSFSDAVNGNINGQLSLNGNTSDNRLEAIAAQGNLTFANGLASFSSPTNIFFADFTDPLAAQVAWNGQTVQVISASSNRLSASGTLTPSFQDGFNLESFDLALNAQDYALAELPFDLPEILALSGRTNFNGRVTGSPSAPRVNGSVQLANLVVNQLPFDSYLAGTLSYAANTGLGIDLSGSRDKIALNVGPFGSASNPTAVPPLDFDVNWRTASATGQTQGDTLNVQAQNFPLSVLNFPNDSINSIGQLSGTLTTDVAVNLNTQTVAGNFSVDQLGLGYIGIGKLAGQVRYADSLATLTSGRLMLNENFYDVSGRVSLAGPVPTYSVNAATESGNVQNILTALSIYQLDDFRRGLAAPDWLTGANSQSELDAVLATSPTGRANAALLDQLRRLSEIQALEAERAIAEANDPLPPLRDLDGPFAGNIQLNGAGSDFKVDFDIAGANWQWGTDYSAQEVVAKGSLTPNVLTLEPVRFASLISVPDSLIPSGAIPPEVTSTEIEVIPSDRDSGLPSLTGENSNPAEIPANATADPVAAVTLAGQLVYGRETELTSNLQATAQNLEVGVLRDVLQVPLDIEGFANATATLSGTLANPQLRGQANLATLTINDTPIESADAQFLYQNARLNLQSALIANAPENPLTLSAQIPYAFNFMDVQPETNDINVNIDVRDEGLALLNIFNDQVAWESGTGEVSLRVGGTLFSPEIDGFANLENAVLSAQILPDLLTEVNGQATFAGDRIIIENLEGRFSDGKLTAAGTFPLLNPIASGAEISALSSPENNPDTPEPENAEVDFPEDFNPLFPQPLAADRPLTLNFEDIDLNLEGLYAGGVYGQVVIGGSALLRGPQIGGEVILSNGQILLPDGSGASNTEVATAASTGEIVPISIASPGGIVPDFRNLRLTLGDSIRIVQGNLLNFVADGTLALNGSPQDLEPDGTIRLRSGRINLYTTVFRLRGRNNTATFTPDTGLQNPFLDVSLRASVPEVNNTTAVAANTPFASAEIADTSGSGFETAGSLRTIRVRADVVGPANTIFENLELSSSPTRSQDELITLIGGGFIAALESTVGSLSGGGDSFQGLINLVGGAVLNNVQDVIGNALSVSELRLFPVTSANRPNGEQEDNTGLDIGAEVGFDITDSTTLSVLKVLTDSSNPEFGANYRLTDALTVRGTTNFEDINQILLEYELRF